MSDFYTSKPVICRKPHRCQWCYTTIQIGEQAEYIRGTYDGDFFTAYMHPECNAAMLRDPDIEDEWPCDIMRRGMTQRETEQWEREHVDELDDRCRAIVQQELREEAMTAVETTP